MNYDSINELIKTKKLNKYAGLKENIMHRKDNNKKEIVIYDYVDDNFKQTRNMYEKR